MNKEITLDAFDSIDRSSRDYCYDELRVMRSSDGKFYYGTDAGCSCPIPFDRYQTVEDWTPITLDDFNTFATAVRNWANNSEYLDSQTIESFIDWIKAAISETN